MPLYVLPNRRFREGVEADSLPFAVGRNRLELFVAKDRGDPVHANPVGAGERLST